jgi:hypothetical protein
MPKHNPKAVAESVLKVSRRCRGQLPETIEPGSVIAARLERRHKIAITATVSVGQRIRELLAGGDRRGAQKFDSAVRQEWCQVNLGTPKCNEDISKVVAELVETGAGMDGLEFTVTCPKCGCVSRHRIAL